MPKLIIPNKGDSKKKPDFTSTAAQIQALNKIDSSKWNTLAELQKILETSRQEELSNMKVKYFSGFAGRRKNIHIYESFMSYTNMRRDEIEKNKVNTVSAARLEA